VLRCPPNVTHLHPALVRPPCHRQMCSFAGSQRCARITHRPCGASLGMAGLNTRTSHPVMRAGSPQPGKGERSPAFHRSSGHFAGAAPPGCRPVFPAAHPHRAAGARVSPRLQPLSHDSRPAFSCRRRPPRGDMPIAGGDVGRLIDDRARWGWQGPIWRHEACARTPSGGVAWPTKAGDGYFHS
jgi:hypothetical protein